MHIHHRDNMFTTFAKTFTTATTGLIRSAALLPQQVVRNMARIKHKQPDPKYKLKTKSSVKKRFHVTGTGEVTRRMAGKQHHSWAKSASKIKELGKSQLVPSGFRQKIIRLMAYKH